MLSCCLLQGLRTTSLKEFIIKRSRTVRNKNSPLDGEKRMCWESEWVFAWTWTGQVHNVGTHRNLLEGEQEPNKQNAENKTLDFLPFSLSSVLMLCLHGRKRWGALPLSGLFVISVAMLIEKAETTQWEMCLSPCPKPQTTTCTNTTAWAWEMDPYCVLLTFFHFVFQPLDLLLSSPPHLSRAWFYF